MTTSTATATSILPAADIDRLRLAMAGYLARYRGQPRRHTESDLRLYLRWCVEQGFDPLAATRPHVEVFVRWMQGPSRAETDMALNDAHQFVWRPAHENAWRASDTWPGTLV